MNYLDLLQEIQEEIKPQESPDPEETGTDNYESAFALGKLDAVLGVAPRRDYQGYKRGYALGILEKLDIQEKDRDFRSEF